MAALRCGLAAIAVVACASGVSADTGLAEAGPSNPTVAFERAYGASFFYFDACGDGLSGRIYRQALVDKLMHCPFTDAAKVRFRIRATMQRRKASEMIQTMIDRTGGMPVRLEGMTLTCREQMDSSNYQAVRSHLEAYTAGAAGRDDIIPAACDAAQITP